MAKLIDDGGKSYHDQYTREKRTVEIEFQDNAFHGAIVLSDEGNYWAYCDGDYHYPGYWQRLSKFHVWFLKLIGRI